MRMNQHWLLFPRLKFGKSLNKSLKIRHSLPKLQLHNVSVLSLKCGIPHKLVEEICNIKPYFKHISPSITSRKRINSGCMNVWLCRVRRCCIEKWWDYNFIIWAIILNDYALSIMSVNPSPVLHERQLAEFILIHGKHFLKIIFKTYLIYNPVWLMAFFFPITIISFFSIWGKEKH